MSPRLTYWTLTLLLFLSLSLAFEQPAHAYTDPGSTLLLFQSLAAIASGVLFHFRRRVKRLFTRVETSKPVATPSGMSRADS